MTAIAMQSNLEFGFGKRPRPATEAQRGGHEILSLVGAQPPPPSSRIGFRRDGVFCR
jgi:hypothetical protein